MQNYKMATGKFMTVIVSPVKAAAGDEEETGRPPRAKFTNTDTHTFTCV